MNSFTFSVNVKGGGASTTGLESEVTGQPKQVTKV